MQILDKKHLEIIKIAPKAEERPALAGIYVEEGRTTVTDGHRLLSVHSFHVDTQEKPPQSIQWDSDKKPFAIPSSLVKEVLKTIPKKTPGGKIAVGLKKHHSGEPVTVACVAIDANGAESVEGPINTGRYPNYKQIMPKTKDLNNPYKYKKIGISAKYLKEVCALLEKYDKNHLVALHVATRHPENKAIIITTSDFYNTSATAIIMPMQLRTDAA